jgi:hypothetical protein
MNSFDKKTPFSKWVTLVSSFVVAFAAVYLGVLALGWDLLGLGLLIQNAPAFAYPFLYAIGIFGVISLVLLLLDALSTDK